MTDSDYEDFLTELAMLVRVPSVTGAEAPFFRILRRELERVGAKVTGYDGLMEARGQNPSSGLVSAHVDRNGLWCTGPGEYQYAGYLAAHRGEKDGDSVSERTLAKIVDRFVGEKVQAYDPWGGGYLGQGSILQAEMAPGGNNVVFGVEGLDHLPPGIPLGYFDDVSRDEDGLDCQMDNVLSVAILVFLFRRGYEGTALFSAQEEAGRSWRFLEAWFKREGRETNELLVLDTSPYPNQAAAEMQDVVLRRRDAHGVFHGPTIERLVGAAEAGGVRYSFKDEYVERCNRDLAEAGERPMSLGRTELGRLVECSGGAINGATVQIPTHGYHTSAERAAHGAVKRTIDLLLEWTGREN